MNTVSKRIYYSTSIGRGRLRKKYNLGQYRNSKIIQLKTRKFSTNPYTFYAAYISTNVWNLQQLNCKPKIQSYCALSIELIVQNDSRFLQRRCPQKISNIWLCFQWFRFLFDELFHLREKKTPFSLFECIRFFLDFIRFRSNR